MRTRTIIASVVLVFTASMALAHVTIRPRESKAGATERYTVRVPTEGQTATTLVELEVPEGVNVVSIEGPAEGREVKKSGDRIVGIAWKVQIPPGELREFVFVATNPAAGTEIAWKAHQHFADGTSRDWIGAAGTREPASLTKLVSGE